MPPPKLELPGFEKSGGENASHMDLGGGGRAYIYIYIYILRRVFNVFGVVDISWYRNIRGRGGIQYDLIETS